MMFSREPTVPKSLHLQVVAIMQREIDYLREELTRARGDVQVGTRSLELLAEKAIDRLSKPEPTLAAPATQAEPLPPEVEQAIEDFAGDDKRLQSILTVRAARMIAAGEAKDEVATKIRKGSKP
jgi:hypothetical protein